MRRTHLLSLILLLALAGGAASCNLPRATQAPGPQAPVISPEAAFTRAAQTVIAGITQAAGPATELPATSTLGALSTETPAALPGSTTPPASVTPTPAASPSPTTPPATLTPPAGQAAPTAPADRLVDDDFSSGRGWYTTTEPDFAMRFVDEAYEISVDLIEAFVWSVRSANTEAGLQDTIVEVDAVRASGPADGWFGLVCRHQDGENYYALVVAEDGEYALVRFLDGEREYLNQGSAPAGLIQGQSSAAGTNRLRAACLGDTLALYANDQLLAQVQDDSLDQGDTGLVAGTQGQEGLVAHFDNFVIYQP